MEGEVMHAERINMAALARAMEELYRGELEGDLREQRGLSGRKVDPFHGGWSPTFLKSISGDAR